MSELSPSLSDEVLPLIPRPRDLLRGDGYFRSRRELAVWAPAEALAALERLRNWLIDRDGPKLTIAATIDVAELVFESNPQALVGEAYRLAISAGGICVAAGSPAGWGHGIQTLIDLGTLRDGAVEWPEVKVEDAPHFSWRGLLLDCCRNFVPKPNILRLLDQMSWCKLNRLHWHLTEDQGWRLEIKRYPRLTSVGASRRRGETIESGYYTQEDVREIVAYAADRGIEIIPEIEMPGHATAALAAYPEMGCTKVPLEVETGWGIFPNNYNAGDEKVFQFLENILLEVIALFPFGYIHLGADECRKAQWRECPECQRRIEEEGLQNEDDLQSYFINRIADFLRRHGRTAIGWDEILEGMPVRESLVQCWRDEHIIKVAVERGYEVIASPRRYCYFDLAVSQVDLSDVYAFDPSSGIDPERSALVLGGEATLWTEYILPHELDEMLFPRLLALSEALWLGPAAKEPFPAFEKRARRVAERFRKSGVEVGPMLRGDAPAESMKGRTDLDAKPRGVEKLIEEVGPEDESGVG